MSLSLDECKWSERLTPTQQGMRCVFTITCVHECVVVRCGRRSLRLLYGRLKLKERYVKVVYAYVCLCVTLISEQPNFPSNFDLLLCPLSFPQEDTLTPSREWTSVFVSCFPNELNTFLHFLWTDGLCAASELQQSKNK